MGFRWRGVIEGFYGQPWTRSEREELLRFLASTGYNAYLYGPKDDPDHRAQWRDLSGDETTNYWRETIQSARSMGIEVGFCLSPGLDIRFHDRSDRAALVQKMLHWQSMGVRLFALLWDDIDPTLKDPEDQARFHDPGEAQADVSNAVYQALRARDAEAEMWFCPTEYWGVSASTYRMSIAVGLDPAIRVFWTGPNICALAISVEATEAVRTRFAHPIAIWDNYPVNDAEMVHELHLGPLERRDPELDRVVDSYFANPMDRVQASRIALHSVGRYVTHPSSYQPERAGSEGLRLWGDRAASVLEVVATATRESCCGFGSPLQEAFAQALQCGEKRPPREALETVAAWEGLDLTTLPPPLEAEIRPWTDRMRAYGAWSAALLRNDSTAQKVAYQSTAASSARILGGILDVWQARLDAKTSRLEELAADVGVQ
jgi:hyaluronoglucosaminidase